MDCNLFFTAVAAVAFWFSLVDAVPFTAIEISSQQKQNGALDAVSSNVLTLSRRNDDLLNTKGRKRRNDNSKFDDGSYQWGIAALRWEGHSTNLVTTIKVDSQEFTVLVDTSSSDTWIASESLRCISLSTLMPISQSSCNFGPLYRTTTATRAIPASLNITYGDHQFVTGYMASQTVWLADISLPNQEIGIVNQAAWTGGDGITSGVLGLAFPSITSAFYGVDPKVASGKTQIIYKPVFTSAWERGIVGSKFSIALERSNGTDGGKAGYLALGGIPPVDYVGNFVSTPLVESTTSFFNNSKVTPELQFYSIVPEAFVYQETVASESSDKDDKRYKTEAIKAAASEELKDISYIISTTSSMLWLPTDIADEINGLFREKIVKSNGIYTIPCKAEAPTIGVKILDEVLWIKADDLIITKPDGSCTSGVADGGKAGQGTFILGEVWLKNVLSVFDVGEKEMRFAARE